MKWSKATEHNKKEASPITISNNYVFSAPGNYIFKLTLNEFIDDNINIVVMARTHTLQHREWGLLFFFLLVIKL